MYMSYNSHSFHLKDSKGRIKPGQRRAWSQHHSPSQEAFVIFLKCVFAYRAHFLTEKGFPYMHLATFNAFGNGNFPNSLLAPTLFKKSC